MKTGVLLLNLGGPETLDEVRPFLFRLFRDPDIIPLPKWLRWLSWPIAWLIAKFRAPKSQIAYASIGGGSPLRKTNDEVAAKLIDKLKDAGIASEIAVAMRYWHPLTDVALDHLEQAGVQRIICVPMYPQYSTTTTMSSYRALNKALASRARRWQPEVIRVLDYHLDDRYQQCVIDRLNPLIEKLDAPADSCAVVFSAHSIPADRVTGSGDPYPQQVEQMVEKLRSAVPSEIYTPIGYQSRVGPVEWVGPELPLVFDDLNQRGIEHCVVVPVSFVSEHVETLEEIDQEYAEIAREKGIKTFLRVPTVKADDDFIDFLAQLVAEQVDAPDSSHCCRRTDNPATCICLKAA